jgi:hypothetical protein
MLASLEIVLFTSVNLAPYCQFLPVSRHRRRSYGELVRLQKIHGFSENHVKGSDQTPDMQLSLLDKTYTAQ